MAQRVYWKGFLKISLVSFPVRRRLGVRLTEIGRITRGEGVVTLRDGEPCAVPGSGWDHFKPSR